MSRELFQNPFRPGSGHMPPFLAGRTNERTEFTKLLRQDVVLTNCVLTGLRGVGKTVLLDTLKPIALQEGWLWAGADLSETTSVTEQRIAVRLITDLAIATSSIDLPPATVTSIGFGERKQAVPRKLDFNALSRVYETTPGLQYDKIKAVLHAVWSVVRSANVKGLILAYDEAQNMADHAAKNEYPLSLMLDVFQSIQKHQIPIMLVLTGLPTLFPKLVDARTYSERMFRVLFLDRLSEEESEQAIRKPIEDKKCPVSMTDESVKLMVRESGGYPYFIQFMCREAYDVFSRNPSASVPISDILRKLDTDFFAGRWANASDRQRDLLTVIAHLSDGSDEFTIQDVSAYSKEFLDKGFNPSHVSQMLGTLQEAGLIFKNRHGKYSFAVPLLGKFIKRQSEDYAH